MDAAEWNARVPVGALIRVRRADGSVVIMRTASEARRVGSYDMIELEGSRGLWLLSWCRPLELPSPS